MSFAPIIPAPGIAGWRFLSRTLDSQQAVHARNPAAQRDEAYLRDRIGTIRTPADLVSDRRMFRIALTAFGLGEDINSRAFVRRVLESDLGDRRSLANRLADKRYLDMATVFAFGDPAGPATQSSGFADAILGRFRAMRFEEAVGESNESMRLVLSLQRELPRIATGALSEDARWFTVLGNRTLRTVFETAFGLPRQFATLDLDRQVGVLKSRVSRLTGSSEIAQFSDPVRLDRLVTRFLTASQLSESAPSSSTAIALSLMQTASMRRPTP